MGRGGRMPSEFTDGGEHRKIRRGRSAASERPKKPAPHIDLRVLRRAKLEQTGDIAWDNYINNLGRENHSVGHAIALGSIAITQVPATQLGEALKEKYPNDFHHHKRKVTLFKRAKNSITGFMREQSVHHQEVRSRELIAAKDRQNCSMGDTPVSTIDGNGLWTDGDNYIKEDNATLDEGFKYSFGPYTSETSELMILGSKAGIDLSLDPGDVLREERQSLYAHIGKNVLKGLRFSPDGRTPYHATVFHYFDHAAAQSIDVTTARMPVSIEFEPPIAEMKIFN